MLFTLSVRSRHVPLTPCTLAWPPIMPSVPTSRATRHLARECVQLIDHPIDRRADPEEFTLDRLSLDLELHLLAQISFGHRLDHPRHFAGGLHQIRDQRVERVDAPRPQPARGPDRG